MINSFKNFEDHYKSGKLYTDLWKHITLQNL